MNLFLTAKLSTYSRLASVLLLLVISTVLSVAQAHGPTRQKVTEEIEINASAEDVWALIKDFGEAHVWLPMVQSSESDNGNEPGAIRTLHLGDGIKIVEKMKTYNPEKMSYKYRIPDATHDVDILPVNNYSSTISVSADGDKSIVTWKGAFYRGYPNNDPPPELNDEAAVKAVTAIYKAGLAGLKEVAEKLN